MLALWPPGRPHSVSNDTTVSRLSKTLFAQPRSPEIQRRWRVSRAAHTPNIHATVLGGLRLLVCGASMLQRHRQAECGGHETEAAPDFLPSRPGYQHRRVSQTAERPCLVKPGCCEETAAGRMGCNLDLLICLQMRLDHVLWVAERPARHPSCSARNHGVQRRWLFPFRSHSSSHKHQHAG
jgi:hypothetical protein